MPVMIVDSMIPQICPGCVKPIRPSQRYEVHDKQNWHTKCLMEHLKGGKWEVNDVLRKQEIQQEPPPCGDMGVTDGADEEGDVNDYSREEEDDDRQHLFGMLE